MRYQNLLISDETNALNCIPLQIPAEQSRGDGQCYTEQFTLIRLRVNSALNR